MSPKLGKESISRKNSGHFTEDQWVFRGVECEMGCSAQQTDENCYWFD